MLKAGEVPSGIEPWAEPAGGRPLAPKLRALLGVVCHSIDEGLDGLIEETQAEHTGDTPLWPEELFARDEFSLPRLLARLRHEARLLATKKKYRLTPAQIPLANHLSANPCA